MEIKQKQVIAGRMTGFFVIKLRKFSNNTLHT